MEPERLEAERARFNALSPDEAKDILAKVEGEQPDFRSCWYCNGAHEHLKNREVMLCFACGYYYLSGYPAPAIVRRSKGEEVTMEDMAAFNTALESA